MKKMMKMAAVVVGLAAGCGAVLGEKIGDVVRLTSEQPNEIAGMGLVVGLKGTGDGGDFAPAMRPLKEMMRRFDDPVLLEKELKNANNVAIVMLSAKLPAHGVNTGDRVDVRVSAVAAKSLKGGHLFIVPLLAPRTDVKVVLASASGELVVEDDSVPTQAVIRGGATMIEDVLPEEIKGDAFTLVLRTAAQGVQRATAVAEAINQELAVQTEGKAVALAVDATSVNVTIPRAERGNTAAFLARLLDVPRPEVNDPAKIYIDRAKGTIVFSSGVELSPTTIDQDGISITVGKAGEKASLKDLQDAFDLMKVSQQQRIAIVELLARKNVLKAELETE